MKNITEFRKALRDDRVPFVEEVFKKDFWGIRFLFPNRNIANKASDILGGPRFFSFNNKRIAIELYS